LKNGIRATRAHRGVAGNHDLKKKRVGAIAHPLLVFRGECSRTAF
jgi:hypothetical protein